MIQKNRLGVEAQPGGLILFDSAEDKSSDGFRVRS